MEKSSS